jgi:hypothetical protein
MSATLFLTLAVALASPAETTSAPADIAYVGVDAAAAPEQVAMVRWEGVSDDQGHRGTVVKSMFTKDDSGVKAATRKYNAAAVRPGRYELSMVCAESGDPVFLVFETEFVAGKSYRLTCEGRNSRSMKVVATEL